ncbi:uncharacterized protein LTR77_010618 [Saxophila tyrrhenica]|uniref:Heterokaryon incompatibility domain-containing protein n=1 Tax=Saxophila tyrrhenica TaxID=1690608 RepID=A0AAV9NYI7_9PEZI|nr:hypothetical protein LTR77_010618 [Saxophila tyrrhenica]
MRLINTTTLTFKEFLDPQKCHHAILSHRWTDEEVSYEDFLLHQQSALPRHSLGWKKIREACELARLEQLEWLWVDTCCIDKRSSAELTEAINSMYNWYAWSRRCFVFLHNVGHDVAQLHDEGRNRRCSHVYGCPFELLAPDVVLFFNSAYEYIGSKAQLAGIVSDIVNIRPEYIVYPERIGTASVGERMKWASWRKTTREEDMSYCLLGMFGVSIPLLYGEGGTRAFLRLQLELMRYSDDESLFAWSVSQAGIWNGLLAPSPAAFSSANGLSIEVESSSDFRQPYAMTNKDIEMTLDLPLDMELIEDWVRHKYGPAIRMDGVRGLILLPWRCRCVVDGVAQRVPAIAIAAAVKSKETRVIEGSRLYSPEVLPVRSGPDDMVRWVPQEERNWACVVGEYSGPTEKWRVCFPQDGINGLAGSQ